MGRMIASHRLAPIIAGVAGLAWFWAELAPQRTGFSDTDDPAMGLRFVAAHPEAWAIGGLALGIASIALIATALSMRLRLGATEDGTRVDVLTVVGLFAAAMLFGMGVVRMAGGPMLYVRGLDQGWGETTYLVTQFVGVQLLLPGGLILLNLWIVGVAWLGACRRAVATLVAALAILPALRLLGILGPFGITIDALWFVTIVAIPAAFAWLVLLGAMPSKRVERAAPGEPAGQAAAA
jgi:hypothetical protein